MEESAEECDRDEAASDNESTSRGMRTIAGREAEERGRTRCNPPPPAAPPLAVVVLNERGKRRSRKRLPSATVRAPLSASAGCCGVTS